MLTESDLIASRAWLVRLCTRLAGNPDLAEDLAQETLYEAWRNLHRLESPEGWQPWLAGIARNVARRWWRSELLRGQGDPAFDLESLPAGDDADPEQRYLEGELRATLAAGLASMPVASREALTAFCLEDRPQAEIAADLGIAEQAVSARVYRGKRALRAALDRADLRAGITAYGFGFGGEQEGAWRDTAIRCPLCGIHSLQFHFDRETDSISVRCTGACVGRNGGTIIGRMTMLPGARRLSSPKAILTRHLTNAHTHYRTVLEGRGLTCPFCNHFVPVQTGYPASEYAAGVYIECPNCGCIDDTSLWHLTLDHPATQQFWRRHPRMHALPIREVEHEGIPAVVTGFQSRDASARIEVLYSPAWYEILHIETAAG